MDTIRCSHLHCEEHVRSPGALGSTLLQKLIRQFDIVGMKMVVPKTVTELIEPEQGSVGRAVVQSLLVARAYRIEPCA